MKKYTYFIADLHLDADLENINEKFQFFLTKLAPTADAVYILGDLFRLWVGDDVTSAYIESIKKDLKNLSKTVPIFLIPGNRDYLLGPSFASAAGCQLLHDPELIDLYGTLTLLTHGDIFCSTDHMHMLFRRLILNNFVMKIFLFLPMHLRKFIAEMVHLNSTKQNQCKTPTKMDVAENSIIKVIKKNRASQIIHGHTHKAAIINFTVDEKTVRRISLDDWDVQGHTLKYYDDGNIEMLKF